MDLNYIQRLKGSSWTDHNPHDPGITILEALEYALTDLRYRTGFAVRDVVQQKEKVFSGVGRRHADFFTAAEILPVNPLTAQDYRKLLIDLPYVRNAWVAPEMPAKGVYNVYVELEEPFFPDKPKNDRGTITHEFMVNGTKRRVTISVQSREALRPGQGDDLKITHVQVKNLVSGYFSAGQRVHEAQLQVSAASGRKEMLTVHILADDDLSRESLLAELQKRGATAMTHELAQLLAWKEEQLKKIRAYLLERRNLCEDFRAVQEVGVQFISVSGEIEIGADTDAEELLADIYERIDRFLSPPVRFYSLQELLGKGKSAEEIFNGPHLKNGFVDDDELAALDARKSIFTAEIIALILGVNKNAAKRQVWGVNNLTLSASMNGVATGPVDTCIALDPNGRYQPKFAVSENTALFRLIRNGNPVAYDPKVVWEKYQQRTTKPATLFSRRVVLSGPDLPVPEGNDRELSRYYSIRDLFPLIYGIGAAGLPASASAKRKGQAKQLQAYLLFFEQMLANHLAQLHLVKDQLSVDNKLDRTRFAQSLAALPEADILLKPKYEEFVQEIQAASPSFTNAPKGWKQDEYQLSRLLDHLLARFGESFTEYEMLRLGMRNNYQIQEYLDKKRYYLAQQHLLGRDRAKAFNYLQSPVAGAESDNISGLERKLRLLLNLETWKDYFELYDETDLVQDNLQEFRFRLRDETGKIILSSSTHYHKLSDAWAEIEAVGRFGGDIKNYKIFKAENRKWYFNLENDKREVIARRIEPFDTTGEILKVQNGAVVGGEAWRIAGFLQKMMQNGRFFLIESVLLRHKGFLPPSGKKQRIGNRVGEIMPQSSVAIESFEKNWQPFQLTAVFVYREDAFSPYANEEYRAYVEQILRRETPAHIQPRVCWVKENRLKDFIPNYLDWRVALAQENIGVQQLATVCQKLDESINKLCLK